MMFGVKKHDVDITKLVGIDILGYQLMDKLGGGDFGHVYRGSGADGSLVAVKFMHNANEAEDEMKALNAIRGVQNVQQLLTSGKYKNSVSVIVTNLFFMPLSHLGCRNTSDRRIGSFKKETLQKVLYQCVQALEGVHKRSYVHRDIKSDNVLTTYPKGQHNMVKVVLVDFGLASEYGGKKRHSQDTDKLAHSSPFVCADEDIQSRPIDDIVSTTYMGLDLSNGQFAPQLSSERLLNYKIGLIDDPAIQLNDSVAWLLPFFDETAKQYKAETIDYEKLKKSIKACIEDSNADGELQMVIEKNKWRLH